MQDITFVLKARNEAGRATKALANDFRRAGTSAKTIKKEAARAKAETARLAAEAKRTGDNFQKSSKQVNLMRGAIRGVVGLLAGISALGIFTGAIREAREFNAALAETTTLISGTERETALLRQEASRLVQAYGGSGTAQLQGFYQAISAGVGDVADASKFLDAANKLAIGGVTDVTTAIDVLTTAVNAYGPDVLSAAEASDSLFVAMKAGKTTIGQLGSALGHVIPIAASAGVSFDELNAVIATLTTRGVSTNVAVTGVRGVLAAIVKPTKEAQVAAKELGLDFNVAALQSKGFAAFLGDLLVAADGNVAVLAQLFGGVEALVPILSLASGGSEKLAAILADMKVKLGETDVAFNKVSESINKRYDDAISSVRDNSRKLGEVLLRVVVPAMEAFAVVINTVADNADALAIALGLLVVTRLPAMFRALTNLVGVLQLYITGMGGAAAATGKLGFALKAIPFVAVVGVITGLTRSFRDWRETMEFTKTVTEGAKEAQEGFNGVYKAFLELLEGGNPKLISESAETVVKTATANAKIIEKQIDDINAKIREASRIGLFGSGAAAASEIAELMRTRDALESAFADYINSAIEAKGHIIETNAALNDGLDPLREMVRETRAVGEASFANIDPLHQMVSQYGLIGGELIKIRELQNEIALQNAQNEIFNMAADAELLSQEMELSTQEAKKFLESLNAIKGADTFRDQAVKARELAEWIIATEGGVGNLDAASLKVVETLLKMANKAGETKARVDQITAAMNGTSVAAGGVANAIADIQSAFAGPIAKALELAGILGRIPGLLGGIATGINNMKGVASRVADGIAGAFTSADSPIAGALGALKKAFSDFAGGASTADVVTNLNAPFKTTGGGGSGGGGAAASTSALSQAVQQLTDKYKAMRETLGLTRLELEEYNIRQQLAEAAARDGTVVTEEQVQAILKLRDAYEEARISAGSFATGAKLGMQEFADSVQTTMEFARDFTKNAFQGLADTIAEFVKTGKFNWRDLIADLLGQIAQFLANQLVIDFLGLSGGARGGTKGFFGDIFGAIFGGARADGGPTEAGKAYLVGEQGPELFMPNRSGRVISNNETQGMMQQSAPQIVFNINTPDADSFRRSESQIRARMSAALQTSDRRNN